MRSGQLIVSWRTLSRGQVVLPAAVASLLIGAVVVRALGAPYTQLLMSLVLAGAGTLLARVHLAAWRQFPGIARISLAVTVVWLACSFLWVWTDLRAEMLLWRLAWISLIAALGSTHILALWAAARERWGTVEWLVLGCVAVLGLMLIYPAVTTRFPWLPSTAYFWAVSLPAAGTVFGSIAIWRSRADRRLRTTHALRFAGGRWFPLSQVALVAIGLCIGRASAPQRAAIEVQPSLLADLTHEQLTAQLDADLTRLKVLDSDVTDLLHQMEALQRELDVRLEAQHRDYYLPNEDAQLRSQFRRFLAYRASLLRIVTTYAGFEGVSDPKTRARCFLVGFAAGVRTYESSVKIVLLYKDKFQARRKLNESQRHQGVEAGMFDWVYESVISKRNMELAARMADWFKGHRAEWREAHVWPRVDRDWLDTRIVTALDYVRQHPIDHDSASVDLFLQRLEDEAYGPLYKVQSTIVEWMGDTCVVEQPASIQSHQIKHIESELRPGDILLQRREWCIGNAFLPGFWSHAALYVGRIEDLRRMGIADHPTVQKHLAAYLAPTSDGNDRTIIEALSEGVVFNSLGASLHADYAAVLRPNLSEDQIARAIVSAFDCLGKPYDFEFDFATADKLVCTELVYRAYQGMLHFDLVRIMGRNTLPASEIARKFVRERHDPHRELDLVQFYETPPSVGYARPGTEQRFVAIAASPSGAG